MTPTSRRVALRVLAFAVCAMSTVYTAAWMYYVRTRPRVHLGVTADFDPPDIGRISYVEPKSAAAAAGVRSGDRVLAVNGRPLVEPYPFYEGVQQGRPGQNVVLSLERPGEAASVAVTAVLRPSPARAVRPPLRRRIVLQALSAYPLLFLIVSLVVLLQRPEDRSAWLLALVFAGFIAAAPMREPYVRPELRGFSVAYVILFTGLLPALFYWFFATFPGPSAIDRRLPWLKYVATAMGAAVAVPLALVALVTNGSWGPTTLAQRFDTPVVRAIGGTTAFAYSSVFFLGLASLVWNAWRSPDADARRKARVIVWATVVSSVPVVVLSTIAAALDQTLDSLPFWLWSSAVLLLLLLPLSFAYAVVKHRVLEIPVLLRRSARYLLVLRGFSILLLFLSIVVTLIFAAQFGNRFRADADVAIPIGALFGVVIAWAGLQSQRRITRRIDRAFFRSAYDARRILEDLADRTRAAMDRGELARLIEQHVREALHPAWMAVDLQAPSTMERDAELVIPMPGRERGAIGAIVLGPRLSDEPYSGEDRRLLGSVASQAATALENILMAERMAARLDAERRATREIEIAREVQQRLLPHKSPSLRTLEYAGACLQARVVGGDYYDFLDLGPTRLGLVLADVSGKGIAAALLMANLQANLRSQYALALTDLNGLLCSVNQLFHEASSPNRYATLFFGVYDDETRRLAYANCGHNPPLVLRANATAEWLAPTAPVVGLFDEWQCAVDETRFEAGDTFVLFTDGVTEAMSDAGEEFGDARLLALVRAHAHLPPSAMLDRIVEAVRDFSESEQEDDLTLIVGRIG
jgi:sigma-B regulation protein RsbU (phosphoserine phosphatase)